MSAKTIARVRLPSRMNEFNPRTRHEFEIYISAVSVSSRKIAALIFDLKSAHEDIENDEPSGSSGVRVLSGQISK
jgi:hypothetical protein